MRYKRPAQINIGLDLDPDITAGHTAKISEGAAYKFINTDALHWLKRYVFRGDEFIYADPPYVRDTRRSHRDIYQFEYTDEQHKELLNCLRYLPCKVMISGYWSDLYDRELAGWNVITYEAITRAGTMATEHLWMNYPKPLELHDYSYLGDDFRERERIKRKVERWVRRVEKMPPLERQALLSAIAEASPQLTITPGHIATIDDYQEGV